MENESQFPNEKVHISLLNAFWHTSQMYSSQRSICLILSYLYLFIYLIYTFIYYNNYFN